MSAAHKKGERHTGMRWDAKVPLVTSMTKSFFAMGSDPMEVIGVDVVPQAPRNGIIYDVVNMNREMFMGCAARMPQVRYSAAYPTRAECMLRRKMKTTMAIYCGNQVLPCKH